MESKMRSLSHVFNDNKKDIDETLNLSLNKLSVSSMSDYR